MPNAEQRKATKVAKRNKKHNNKVVAKRKRAFSLTKKIKKFQEDVRSGKVKIGKKKKGLLDKVLKK